MLHAALGLPYIKGIPLRLTYLEKTGDRDVLNTYRIDRANLPAPQYFNKPPGLTLAHSSVEVLASPEQLKMLQSLAGSGGAADPKALAALGAALNKNSYDKKIDVGGGRGSTARFKQDET